MTRQSRNLVLFSILVLTAVLWAGVAGIGLNSDDYQYIPSLAPIAHPSDIFRPFIQPDANPSYFRPVANLTMALDFLLFGWSGAAFHLTNLLLHLIATLLVFYFARDVFRMREKEALVVALAFGLVASHEYNLLVNTARADMLAAIFVMLTLLCYHRGIRVASLICFALALLSKEIAVLILPFIPLVSSREATDKNKWKWQVLSFTPYLAIFIAFYFYRSHFTAPILSSQPLTTGGARSAMAFLRNGAYSLGYFVLPLDLSQATAILAHYRAMALLLGAISIILFVWIIARGNNPNSSRPFFRPIVFTLLTGSILFLTFERWRLYLPSIGLIAIIVLAVNRIASMRAKRVMLLLFVSLGAFHVYRALAAQSAWREGTALRDHLKNNLTEILSQNAERPLTLGILASPAKLGSASVILLGEDALVRRAEADRLSAYNKNTGSEQGVRIDSWTAVDVYTLDRAKGFRGLTVDSLESRKYFVSVPVGSSMVLYPSSEPGSERRDLVLQTGDSSSTANFTDIIRAMSAEGARSIEVDVHNGSSLLLTFDSSNRFRRIY